MADLSLRSFASDLRLLEDMFLYEYDNNNYGRTSTVILVLSKENYILTVLLYMLSLCVAFTVS